MAHVDRPFIPSPQQQAIFDWTAYKRGSAVVEAVAGAGKTTTLVKLLSLTKGTVAFMAYNTKIVVDIKAKVDPLGLGNRIRCGTVHSFGNSAIWRAFPNTTTDGKKLQKLLANRLRDAVPEEMDDFLVAAVSMAKQVGIGALTRIEDDQAWSDMFDHHDLMDNLPDGNEYDFRECVAVAKMLLKASWDATPSVIDFDDMIYETVRRGLRVWQNDWVLLDEAQDTNPTRRALAKMMLKPNGRLVAVGDPRQAIYGFTGADADALGLIEREFNTTNLPLTVTYRCPKAVVKVAHRWVQHIQAADSAPEGDTAHIVEQEFWQKVASRLSKTDAILCRNTRPLVKLAYQLIRTGIGCRIEGRSIGDGLLALTSRWRRVSSVGEFLVKLEDWMQKEVAKATAVGNESRAETIEDQYGCIVEISSGLGQDDHLNVLRSKIESLFGDTPAGVSPRVLTLSTIHRSKGREWPCVVWWGAEQYSPSKWARQTWQLGQEDNLCYVAATRAQKELILVDVVTS